jgi:hypothetical protein
MFVLTLCVYLTVNKFIYRVLEHHQKYLNLFSVNVPVKVYVIDFPSGSEKILILANSC